MIIPYELGFSLALKKAVYRYATFRYGVIGDDSNCSAQKRTVGMKLIKAKTAEVPINQRRKIIPRRNDPATKRTAIY